MQNLWVQIEFYTKKFVSHYNLSTYMHTKFSDYKMPRFRFNFALRVSQFLQLFTNIHPYHYMQNFHRLQKSLGSDRILH